MIDVVNIPLFASLSRVDIARVIAELDEVSLLAGEVLFRQGDVADALYILRDGALKAELEGPDGVTTLEMLAPGRIIGEVGLLGDEPRTATIRAAMASSLWRLPREKFDDLIGKHPSLALYFSRLVGKRLANVNQHLRESKDTVADLSQGLQIWSHLSDEARLLLVESVPLSTLSRPLADEMLRRPSAPYLDELERAGAVSRRAPDRYTIRPSLLQLANSASGGPAGDPDRRTRAWHIAERSRQQREYALAIEAYLAGGSPAAAAHMLAEHGGQVLEQCGARQLVAWVEQTAGGHRVAPGVWQLSAQAAEQLGDTGAAALYYRRALGEAEQSGDLEALRRAGAALAELGERAALPGTQPRQVPAAPPAPARHSRRLLDGRARRLAASGALALLGGWLAWWASSAAGLAPEVVRLLAILAGGTVLWLLDSAPEFLTALVMCALALLTGVAPAEVVFSGLTTSGFFLLFAIFAFVALISLSGLSFRVALLGLRLFPATYLGQVWALGLFGLLATPLIPGAAGRLTLISPLVVAIKDALRLPDRSRAAAGLGMAATMGFGQMSFLFLNGSGTTLLIASLLPAATMATWGEWLFAAAPLAAIYFVVSMLVIQWRFLPAAPTRAEPKVLRSQLATLGKLNFQEGLGLAALALLLLIFILQPVHGLEPAWLALLVLGVLAAGGADRAMFRHVDYQYLFYFAAFSSLALMVRTTGADTALLALAQPFLLTLPSSPFLLLSAFTVIAYLLALLPGFPTQPVLMIAAGPLALSLGYNPLVFGLILLMTSTPLLIPRLSSLHWLFWNATEQRVFTHQQVFEFAAYRAAIMLLAVLASIPLWRAIGMVPLAR